ncbi:Hypothetical predicted protein [Olea europaea subsp. europaea]|uniref:Uncharacterized protein n=1 Tax=Olea europaea subsp. europaea TaxID=158383 RepID=A0A8S0QCS4_OLEEU|nr:Hypothetical predicted protein [Olea europaea subsp. europaea]
MDWERYYCRVPSGYGRIFSESVKLLPDANKKDIINILACRISTASSLELAIGSREQIQYRLGQELGSIRAQDTHVPKFIKLLGSIAITRSKVQFIQSHASSIANIRTYLQLLNFVEAIAIMIVPYQAHHMYKGLDDLILDIDALYSKEA